MSPPEEATLRVLYLGSATESDIAHWGGAPRRARVVGRPRLSRGDAGWLVVLDEPIPAVDGTPLDRVVLADRLEGRSIDDLQDVPSRDVGTGWVPVHVARLRDPAAANRSSFDRGDLVNEYWAEVALRPDNLPKAYDVRAAWESTLRRIRRFIEEHGNARVPDDYHDDDGRLDVIVENIRWHHAGKAGISPGPFPGIDYAAELDRLPGWEW